MKLKPSESAWEIFRRLRNSYNEWVVWDKLVERMRRYFDTVQLKDSSLDRFYAIDYFIEVFPEPQAIKIMQEIEKELKNDTMFY